MIKMKGRIVLFPGVIVLFVMAVSTISTILAIIFVYIADGQSHPVPAGARKFAFHIMAPILCMRNSVPHDKIHASELSLRRDSHLPEVNANSPTQLGDAKPERYSHEIQEVLMNIRCLKESLLDREKDDHVKEEWRALAKVLDRFFFWITLVIVAVFIAVALSQRDYSH